MSAQLSIRKDKLIEWLETEQTSVDKQIESLHKTTKTHFDLMFEYDVLSYRLKWIKSQINKLNK